jgi:MraZ protein
VLFRGVSQLTLDSKGRMAMPARYRQVLDEHCQGHLVITVDPDHCLLLYPLPEWVEIEAQINSWPTINPEARKLQRLLVGHATEVDMDASGRLLVPPPLRGFAYLDKNVVLTGQGKKFELWDEATWNSRRDLWLQEPIDLSALPKDLGNFSY